MRARLAVPPRPGGVAGHALFRSRWGRRGRVTRGRYIGMSRIGTLPSVTRLICSSAIVTFSL